MIPWTQIVRSGLCLLLSALAPPAAAQGHFCQERDVLSAIDLPGTAHCIAISGDIAVIGASQRQVQVVDVSDPRAPKMIGSVTIPGTAQDIDIRGGFAFVAAYDEGLQIVDISDPTNPFVLVGYDTISFAEGVVALDQHVYLAAGNEGLLVFDIENVFSPKLVARIHTNVYAKQIAIQGDIAYMAATRAVRAFDISNPGEPLHMPEADLDVGNDTNAVAIDGNRLYLADRVTGIFCYDISTPTAPVQLSQFAEIFVTVLQPVGNRLYFSRIVLNALDVTDPALPQIVAWFPVGAQDMIIVGDLAYTIAGSGDEFDLRIVRLDEDHFPIRGVYDNGIRVDDVVVQETTAFVAHRAAPVNIVDLSDPASPLVLGSVPVAAMSLDINGDTLFIADASIGLTIADISDLTKPVILSQLPLFNGLRDLRYQNGMIIVVTVNHEVYLINAFDLANPYVAAGPIETDAETVTLDGNLAYIARAGQGISIADISNIKEEVPILSRLDTSGIAEQVASRDGFLFIADSIDGLQIIDARDPTQPIIIAELDSTSASLDVSLAGDLLFVADNVRLRIIDITDLYNPFERAVVSLGSSIPVKGVTVQGRLAYINTYTDGVVIYDFSDCPPCPADLTGDGQLDFFDVQVFLTLFAGTDPVADFNADGLFDFFDVIEFLSQFDAGCP